MTSWTVVQQLPPVFLINDDNDDDYDNSDDNDDNDDDYDDEWRHSMLAIPVSLPDLKPNHLC